MKKDAKFSECGRYRYQLSRIWGDPPYAMCIGLNPSTANAEDDDPTITHLTRILQSNGYGGFYMMNLFAFISSDPEDLRSCPDPVKDNDKWLWKTYLLVQDVIACYGAFKIAGYRAKQIKKIFPVLKCFGKTKEGHPLHPMALWRKGIKNI